MAEHSKLVPVAGPADALLDYPPERLYVRWAAPASVGFHLLIGLIFLALVYLHHIKNLRDLMTASITQLPADQIQILLIDENKPPPPTDHPLWIKQLIIPKVKPPPPPPPPPKPRPKPKPQVVHIVPKLVVGRRSLPSPSYPAEAYEAHIQGTVTIQVKFDADGGVENADVVESSGSALLDSSARHDILSNWHDPDFAGQTQTVPIRFELPH